jgi:hypothetical protein
MLAEARMNRKSPARKAPVRPVVVRSTKLGDILACGRTKANEISKLAGFPRPVDLGGRARGFIIDEVHNWLTNNAPRG